MLCRICFKLLLCAVGLRIATAMSVQAADLTKAQNTPSTKAEAIPWNQIGVKAGADYQGEGLSVIATDTGVGLHCVFQRMDGEATAEGLWLVSTVTNQPSDRFRVTEVEVGTSRCDVPARVPAGGTRLEPGRPRESIPSPDAALGDGDGAARHPYQCVLPHTGIVRVNGQTVRFIRPGLTEEYSVSMDGIRQDFLVAEKPAGAGELQVRLSVSGARVEATPHGAQLVLEKSGRRIAYSRLRATDATGRELPAKIEAGRITPCAPMADRMESDLQANDGAHGVTRPTLAIFVNDTGAVYPVRIDPTFSDANWISLAGVNGTDGTVYAAATDGSGNLYVGGAFTIAGDVIANNVAKWNGSSWAVLGSGINNQVNALVLAGNTLYAGGNFTTAGGTSASFIAQWNGSSWSPLGSGIGGGTGGNQASVSALAVSGGTLYAGGQFTKAGGTNATNIAQWNGSSWLPLGSGIGGNQYSYVGAMAVSGGTLYAGGYFTSAGGTNANYIAQWNGSSWSPLGLGMNYYVHALAVSGGALYAGGAFFTAGRTNANYIAQWNGSSWSPLGSGLGLGPGFGGTLPEVQALAVSGDTLYAGGGFTMAGGTLANSIAQWNGSSWSPLGSGMSVRIGGPEVYALVVSGGTLYAGGYFTSAGGTNANFIAQWNGSSWSPLGSGINSNVSALAISGGTLYAGGNFTTAGGKLSAYVAEAYLVAPPGGIADSIVIPSSGLANVKFYGNPGQQFGVQRATTLSPPGWTTVSPNPLSPAADGSFTFVDTNAPAPAAYYRVFQY